MAAIIQFNDTLIDTIVFMHIVQEFSRNTRGTEPRTAKITAEDDETKLKYENQWKFRALVAFDSLQHRAQVGNFREDGGLNSSKGLIRTIVSTHAHRRVLAKQTRKVTRCDVRVQKS